MTSGEADFEETAEDLYEDAPCGYLSCRPDGTITRVNRTFEAWTGHKRETVVGRRFSDLLTGAGRIYHETHYAPLLRMQGTVREIAVDIVRSDGTRLPALVNAVLRTDADGCAQAIRTTIFDATDRRRYEQELLEARRRERHISQELQRSLLTGELAQAAGLAVDVHYQPAGQGLEAGGDWYDAFWLDDRRVALVVGDVVGRGIAAAATMGQLRSAIRALASTGLTPGPLLEALDGYAARHELGRMATVAYMELCLDARRLTYSIAGHPPPVLWGEASAVFLDGARSVPLDAAPSGGHRPESTVRMDRSAGVVLYTDGLVERRSRPLSAGLDQLLEAVRTAGGSVSPHALARRMEADTVRDDVCVLVASLAAD